jgi:hypothetical protein
MLLNVAFRFNFIVLMLLDDVCVKLLHCRTFKAFGHDAVHVLNGGLPAWISANQQVDSGAVVLQSTRPSTGLVQKGGNTWLLKDKGFRAKLQPHMVRTLRQVWCDATNSTYHTDVVRL